jgi:hypothetical protein
MPIWCLDEANLAPVGPPLILRISFLRNAALVPTSGRPAVKRAAGAEAVLLPDFTRKCHIGVNLRNSR